MFFHNDFKNVEVTFEGGPESTHRYIEGMVVGKTSDCFFAMGNLHEKNHL